MMPEGEEAPAVRFRELRAVFYGDVDPVVFPVEETPAGWLSTRAVGKGRLENPGELLDDDRSLGERPGLQICLDVLPLDVHVMVFGKVGRSVIQPIGGQWGSDEDPPPE